MELRDIGAAVIGAERVAAEWLRDGGLRSEVRRRIERAEFLMEAGYRDLAAGRVLRPFEAWKRARRRQAAGRR